MISRRNLYLMTTSAVAMAVSALAFGGGYWLEFANPSASADPAAKDALAIVRSLGCGNPSESKITATAEGLVNGQRKSVALESVALSAPGVYAIKGSIPAEGVWVVSAKGLYLNHGTGAVAPIVAKKLDRKMAAYVPRNPTAADVDGLLKTMAAPKQTAAR